METLPRKQVSGVGGKTTTLFTLLAKGKTSTIIIPGLSQMPIKCKPAALVNTRQTSDLFSGETLTFTLCPAAEHSVFRKAGSDRAGCCGIFSAPSHPRLHRDPDAPCVEVQAWGHPRLLLPLQLSGGEPNHRLVSIKQQWLLRLPEVAL